EPFTLLVRLQVPHLPRETGRVHLSEPVQHFAPVFPLLESERASRDLQEVFLGDSVEFRSQLHGSRWRRTKRIDGDCKVTIVAYRLDQAGCRCNLSQHEGARDAIAAGVRSGKFLGKAEDLPP